LPARHFKLFGNGLAGEKSRRRRDPRNVNISSASRADSLDVSGLALNRSTNPASASRWEVPPHAGLSFLPANPFGGLPLPAPSLSRLVGACPDLSIGELLPRAMAKKYMKFHMHSQIPHFHSGGWTDQIQRAEGVNDETDRSTVRRDLGTFIGNP